MKVATIPPIKIEQSLYNRLKENAYLEGVSLSEKIRELIRASTANAPQKRNASTKKVENLIQRFGIDNEENKINSTNFKKYIYK